MTCYGQPDLVSGCLTENHAKHRSRGDKLKKRSRCDGAGDDQNELNVGTDHNFRPLEISLRSPPPRRDSDGQRPQMLGSVINTGNRIEHLFLAAVQMMIPLFLDSLFVEIEKIITDYLGSCGVNSPLSSYFPNQVFPTKTGPYLPFTAAIASKP